MTVFLCKAGRVALVLLACLVLVWVWLAVTFHASGGMGIALRAGVLTLGLGLIWAVWRHRWGLLAGVTAGVISVAALWWGAQVPLGLRDWDADVAFGVTGVQDGNLVTLRNVRNFRWKDADTASESWETRVVDIDRIVSVDMLTSVWSSPLIAHVLVSFGFADGQHIVFSGEIRREKGEVYSALGGFFRRYELVLIAADERDIVHLRTDERGEEVSLFPVMLDAEARKALFLSFVNYGNALDAEPQWYHTIIANCTTVPYRLVKGIAPDLAMDWRVLASGQLPEFLHDLGVLRPDMTMEDVRARARLPVAGRNAPEGADYSRDLRRAWVTP
jgi:hypothetical protein